MKNKIPLGKYAVCILLLLMTASGNLLDLANAQDKSLVWRDSHMIFSTYLGGVVPCSDQGKALTYAQNTASDKNGNIYVIGATEVSDLPVLNPFQPTPAADSTESVFVAKYDPRGKMLWCTYLGGNRQSVGLGIAVMPGGGVAVAGLTSSNEEGTFPLANPFQPKYQGGASDYFVTVFDADGHMEYSTYLGGSGAEGTSTDTFADDSNNGNNIAVDAQRLLYVTGTTSSEDFPVMPADNTKLAGKSDAFLAIIDPSKIGNASLRYSRFIGGKDNDKGHSITLKSDGSSIVVAGYTQSSDFPLTPNALSPTCPDAGFTSNGFVSQFIPHIGTGLPYALQYSTYLGSSDKSARDDAYAVALDSNGNILVSGRTQSYGFPMLDSSHASIYNSAPYLQAPTSNDEPYLVKIDPWQSGADSLIYSTFLGGGSADSTMGGGGFCTSIAFSPDGTVFVAGEISSFGIEYVPSSTPVEAPNLFPYTKNALFTDQQGNWDAMLMAISPSGSTLTYSTFFGGQGNDRAYGLCVDLFGGIVMSGLTFSADLPLMNAAQDWPGNEGQQNAFIARFSPGGYLPDAPAGASAVQVHGGGSAEVSFTAPDDNGSPIEFFTVTSYPGGRKANGTRSPITVDGLINGTSYHFKVSAINVNGAGPASKSSNSIIPSTVPGKPTIDRVARGNGKATIYFTAPPATASGPGNGGSPITSYKVTSEPGGIMVSRAGSSTSPITIAGLTYNVPCTFTVTAANANGAGAPSDPSEPVTPTASVPDAPTGVTAARAGDKSLSVSFTAPLANGEEITAYTVTAYPGGTTTHGAASPIKVEGLVNGKSYTFSVAATNGIGRGPASARSLSMIPAVAPDVPTIVSAEDGKLQAKIAFKHPASNGGLPVTSYTLTSADPDIGISITKSSSPIVVTGLRNQKYIFSLTANNAVGAGKAASVSVTPEAVIPGAPTNVTASGTSDTAGGKAYVFFDPPAFDGGSQILYYDITSYPDGNKTKCYTDPATVKGLRNGTSYYFKVTARNAVGVGPASAASNKMTPATVPGKPVIDRLVSGKGQVKVYLSPAPASGGVPGNGGSPITSYMVTADPGGMTAFNPSSPITITGLLGGTPYKFTATAVNAIGDSVYSDPSATVIPTASVPYAPNIVSVVPGDGQATVSFNIPSDNGSPIQFYTVVASPGGMTAHGLTSDPITVVGLTNGTAYSFKVMATNWLGTGPGKTSDRVTPSTVPFVPTRIKAVRGNGQATISFAAPSASGGVPGNGGSPITSYTVSVDGMSVTKAASPIVVTGLENGTEYTFKTWANNKNGKGAEGTSNAVTPNPPLRIIN